MNSEYSPVDYDQLLEEIEAAATRHGGQVLSVGTMSTGDDRPLVRYDGSSDREVLILAGEDRDELPGVRAMPEIVEEAGQSYDNLNINILPFFEPFLPVEDELDTDTSVDGYDDVRQVMEDSAILSKEKIEEEYSGELPRQVQDQPILEATYDPANNLVSIKTEQGRPEYHHIDVIVDLLSGELPERFRLHYPAYEGNSVRICFNREKLAGEETGGLSYLHANMMYHREEFPPELDGMRELAQEMDAVLSAHSDPMQDFHLYSIDAPEELTEDIIRAMESDIEIMNKKELEAIGRPDMQESRDGVMQVDGSKARIVGHVNDYGLVVEDPVSDVQGKATVSAVKEFLDHEQENLGTQSTR